MSLTARRWVASPQSMRTTKPTDDDVRDIARVTFTHERSVIRALAGLPVRGNAGRRISQALEARSLAPMNVDAPTSNEAA